MEERVPTLLPILLPVYASWQHFCYSSLIRFLTSFHSTTAVQEKWFHPLGVTLEAVGKEVYFNCHNGLEGVDNISW